MWSFMYVSVHCVCSTYGGQKRASDLLGLELETVVSCHVGTGNSLYPLKSSGCSDLLNHLPSP